MRATGVGDGTCNQINPLIYTDPYKCGFGAAGGTASVPLSDTYSASLVTSFDYGGSTTDSLQGSSFDVRMDVLSVAEPTSVALVGLALLGLGVARRRKDCLFRQ